MDHTEFKNGPLLIKMKILGHKVEPLFPNKQVIEIIAKKENKMLNLSLLIKNEILKLEGFLLKIKKEMKLFPQGSLKVKKVNNKAYYYQRLNNFSKDKYIQKKDIALAKLLAKKSYYKNLVKVVNEELNYLKNSSSKYNYKNIENVYSSLSKERKLLVSPIEPTFQQNVEYWKSIPYDNLKYNDEFKNFITNNNEYVRSKSEKILADLFSSMNLIYKYECPLYLEKYKPIYPDFTFLCPYTNKEIYWEHFGMMDDSEYVIKAMRKIEYYEKHEIFLGDRLLISFEGNNHSLNLELIKIRLEKYLIP